VDIVETPPRRQPWSSREAVEKILEAKMRCSSVQGKQTSGTVAGILVSTYNGLTDMMRCDAAQDNATYGVVVGTGTGAESNTDYKLGTKIATGQGAGQLVYGPVSLIAGTLMVGALAAYILTRLEQVVLT